MKQISDILQMLVDATVAAHIIVRVTQSLHHLVVMLAAAVREVRSIMKTYIHPRPLTLEERALILVLLVEILHHLAG